MKNKYLNFISDEHFIDCIANLHNSYIRAKADISKKKFYKNKIDTIKLTFDSKFNKIDEENIIEVEILRQIDKSINNSIGTFHEQILGGIKGFEIGKLSGFDIKAKDDTLFALFQFDKTSSHIVKYVFEKLAEQAKFFKNATCYLVDFSSTDSFCDKWIIINGENSVSHKRVFKISAGKFYALLSGQDNALFQLKNALPIAIKNYLDAFIQKKVETIED